MSAVQAAPLARDTAIERAAEGGASARWWLGWTLVALLLAEGPLILAALAGPAGLTGLGTFWFVNDFAQYESAMRQGWEGPSWLVYDRFTPEAHAAALMFTPYVALGKLAALLGLGPLALYRPAELLCRLGLLLGLRAFIVALLPAAPNQRLAAIVSLFGMGLGLPVAIAGAILGIKAYTGNGSYEVNTFGLLFSAPHAALAMGVTLAVVAAILRGLVRARSLPLYLLAGVALSLLHPFHLPSLCIGLGVYALWRLRAGERGPLFAVGALALGAAPLALYDALTFGRDPFWSATYSAQNLLPSPTPLQLPVEYGVLLALAIPGAWLAARRGGVWWAVLAWLAALLVCAYLPVPFQRRLAFGLQPVLAVLATLGLAWLTARLAPRPVRWLRGATLAFALCTTATVTVGIVQSALAQQPLKPYRADTGSAAAADYLATHACPADVVLADWDLSNYLAGQTGSARVAGGHPVATLDTTARKLAFDAADHDPARWAALVARFQPSYVLYGPAEAGLPPPDGARRVFTNGGATLYALDGRRCG